MLLEQFVDESAGLQPIELLDAAPIIISIVSIPVTPNTPGDTAQTLRTWCGMASAMYCFMCRVTSIFSAVRGPNASGVTARLPSPATTQLPWVSFFAGRSEY